MGRGKARIVVSATLGLFPVGAYSLTYLIDAKIVASLIFMLVLGLLIAGFAYTCPAWDDE